MPAVGFSETWRRMVTRDGHGVGLELEHLRDQVIGLLEDLLQLSRLEADKLHPLIQDADALAVIRDAVRSVEPAAERKAVQIEISSATDSIPCRTDPQRVRQILINLLTNAVRHSPENDLIRVDVRMSKSSMRFDVIDHGEGIVAEEQATIFEAFESGSNQRERGTGLGLALSRQLARLLGGDLTVESKLGHGARFTLRLPRQSDVH